MDLTAIFAICLSMGMILGGNALEGGHLSSLMQPTAAMIVFGGTIGATWLGATTAEVKGLFKLMKRIIRPGLADRAKLLEDILRITTIVRRDGMLAVESQLTTVQDPTLRKALQMLVDGNAGEDVKNILEMEMDMLEHHGNASAKLLESAGGYAPTVGILGAVLGLIHVMQNLSDPSKLGTGIAVAFVATIYGVGIANLLFLPLGGRLKKIVGGDTEDRAMVVAGINGIVAGANARQIGEILAPFTHHAGEHEGTTDKEQAA
jgi:chemotaxis protein MotA